MLAAPSGKPLKITVKAAALLDEKPRDDIRSKPLDQKPYWHVERARVGEHAAGAGRADRQRPVGRDEGDRGRRQASTT